MGQLIWFKLQDWREKPVRFPPPLLARTLRLNLPDAEIALANLAERGYLKLLPESGLVRTYSLTGNAYEEIEAFRSRRSIFSGIFQRQAAS